MQNIFLLGKERQNMDIVQLHNLHLFSMCLFYLTVLMVRKLTYVCLLNLGKCYLINTCILSSILGLLEKNTVHLRWLTVWLVLNDNSCT